MINIIEGLANASLVPSGSLLQAGLAKYDRLSAGGILGSRKAMNVEQEQEDKV